MVSLNSHIFFHSSGIPSFVMDEILRTYKISMSMLFYIKNWNNRDLSNKSLPFKIFKFFKIIILKLMNNLETKKKIRWPRDSYFKSTTIKHITNCDWYVIKQLIMAIWFPADMCTEVNFALPSSTLMKRHYFPDRKINDLTSISILKHPLSSSFKSDVKF